MQMLFSMSFAHLRRKNENTAIVAAVVLYNSKIFLMSNFVYYKYGSTIL